MTAQMKLRRADHRHPVLAVLHRPGSREEPHPLSQEAPFRVAQARALEIFPAARLECREVAQGSDWERRVQIVLCACWLAALPQAQPEPHRAAQAATCVAAAQMGASASFRTCPFPACRILLQSENL